MTQRIALPLVNGAEATFECTFGRGCEGICCRDGRPGLRQEEKRRIERRLQKILPLLRPEARKLVQKHGIVTRRTREGLPLVPVIQGWCVFFNQGCVLHRLGEEEGDKFRYKPVQCSLFPLLPDDDGTWYVRQQGYKNEPWNLFCLAPGNSTVPAVQSLREEIALAAKLSRSFFGQRRKRS
jgi:hypothetical protein